MLEWQMKPAAYIDIDCDLYISAYQALDWALSVGVAAPGRIRLVSHASTRTSEYHLITHTRCLSEYLVSLNAESNLCEMCIPQLQIYEDNKQNLISGFPFSRYTRHGSHPPGNTTPPMT